MLLRDRNAMSGIFTLGVPRETNVRAFVYSSDAQKLVVLSGIIAAFRSIQHPQRRANYATRSQAV